MLLSLPAPVRQSKNLLDSLTEFAKQTSQIKPKNDIMAFVIIGLDPIISHRDSHIKCGNDN